MLKSDIAFAQFTSKASSAGVVNVMLGFVPDFAILLADIGGTNPNIYFWANHSTLDKWDVAQSLLLTGSSGIVTQDASGIAVYAGGDAYPAGASQNDDPKYVVWTGALETVTTAGDDTVGPTTTGTPLPMKAPPLTRPGLAIPADHQAASGDNLLICFRNNR